MTIAARLTWLVAALIGSVAATTWAVQARRPELAGLAAGLYSTALILVGLIDNRRLWRMPKHHIVPGDKEIAGVRNASFVALAYAWGAATLTGAYTIGGLVWQHGWQYAAGMAVIAAAIAVYARALATTGQSVRMPAAQAAAWRLTLLHAAAAAGGLAFLFLSGKLKSGRGDWAANIVFLMGGLAVLALSAMAAFTQHRLSRRA
jgi:hypothetical protein